MPDLQVTVSAVLEADVGASTSNIQNAIKSIGESAGPIKVEAELDQSTIKRQAAEIPKVVANAAKVKPVQIEYDVKRDAMRKLRSSLGDLGLDNEVKKMVAGTDTARSWGLQVDKIAVGFQKVGNQAERFVRLTVNGVDEMGRLVTLTRQFDTQTGEISSVQKNVTTNFKQMRQEIDQNTAYLLKQQTAMEKLRGDFTGATSHNGITNTANLAELDAEYAKIIAHMNQMQSSSGKYSATQKAELDGMIARYKQMGEEMRNAEYVATSLRAKTVDVVAKEQIGKFDEYQAQLKQAGILTQEFEQRLNELRTSMGQATNAAGITSVLDDFSKLKGDVGSFKAQISECNELYASLQKVDRELTEVNLALQQTDQVTNPQVYEGLEQQKAALEAQKASLEGQAEQYREIAQYSKQAQLYEQQSAQNATKVSQGLNQMADKAAQVGKEMQSMNTSISATEAKFRGLTNPTEELRAKVASLREMFQEVDNAQGDQAKVQAYERLEQAIKECNTEIAQMAVLERSGMNGEKFQANLAKAKADLAAMRQNWSAFTKDEGLMSQYRQLEMSLGKVSNQSQLGVWTKQLSAFRAQVKAAGRDTQTLGDRFSSALKRVTQWTSAVTILYKGFDIMRRGFETVVDLDTAMTDLRKTTDASEATYAKFYKQANAQAKELGSTTKEVIEQTAAWSRLGYTLQESEVLARNSSIFSSISEDLSMEEATDGLVSVLKAFSKDKSVDDSLDGIVSKVNSVGNAFAVTNSMIVESLKRDSAPLAVANNTMEEAIALATAG